MHLPLFTNDTLKTAASCNKRKKQKYDMYVSHIHTYLHISDQGLAHCADRTQNYKKSTPIQ